MKDLLGGKGANLADMTSIGLPVPPGFTITTEACDFFDKHNGSYPNGMRDEVLQNLKRMHCFAEGDSQHHQAGRKPP